MTKKNGRRKVVGGGVVIGLSALLLAVLVVGATPVLGATVTDRPMIFAFDGGDTSAGPLVKPNKVAIDASSGNIYVSEGPAGPSWRLNEVVSRFSANGVAAPFGATGKSSLFGRPEGGFGASVSIAVDNSKGPTQGRLYVLEGVHHILSAFSPSGDFLWEISGLDINQAERADVAVDAQGHPWVLCHNTVREYGDTGSPPEEIGSFDLSGSEKERLGLDVDASGNIYVAGFSGVDEYVDGAFQKTVTASPSRDVFADQSSASGHVFATDPQAGQFAEYDSAGSLVGAYGGGAIGAARGIAYSPTTAQVYVANQGMGIVEVFGAPTTGTVPDPTIEATTTPGPGTAVFHGTVNPQGVTSDYYFEWVEGSEAGSPFADESKRVFRSPSVTLPSDSSPHAVEYKGTNLRGGTSWTVRLVTENTSNHLRSVSLEDTFKPPKAAAVPQVTISPVEKLPVPPCAIGITTKEACISGTINPKEDSVELKVEWLPGDNCLAELEAGKGQTTTLYVAGGEINSPTQVSVRLVKLIAGEHYCARFNGINSFGASGATAIEQFDTVPEPPSDVSTAFAAPRTDSAARINGRVNPEGKAEFKYQFEWSSDGLTWSALPVREASINVHEPIVVSDQLTGLSPGTRYYYRLGTVENETGPAVETGATKSFVTRTQAEEQMPSNALGEPDRPGIELVNSPDKGNQNVFFETISNGPVGEVPFIVGSGERARWSVVAGAPGSPNGVSSQFLADRTEGGWVSRSLAPPASLQFGGGTRVYNVAAASPDQSHFVVDLRAPGLSASPGSTLVRLDRHQHEDVLATFDWPAGKEGVTGVDMTDDGGHVLTVDPKSKQLVDVGKGGSELVSLMPGSNTASECGLVSYGNSVFASFVGGPQWRDGYDMMATTDANIVYFRAKPDGECDKPWGLYVRDRDAGITTRIDPGTGAQNVEFVRATPDGLHAYFLTASQLDPGSDHNAGVDLYRWDQGSHGATCLTCVVQNASVASSAGGGSVSPVLVSNDFSHAYFVSRRRLVPHEGVVGGENIYALSGGAIRFVATASQLELTREVLSRTNARLSDDGSALIFTSSSGGSPRLTTDSIDCGNCAQLYRYEDGEGSIECVSCASAGATSAALGAGGGVGLNGVFDMSGDGSTVGFVTPQSLAQLDVNGSADVYQWRNGVRRLLTDGTGEAQAGVAAPGVRGIDADGSNMLFSVAEPGLTGFELDGLANLYDARIGGGFEPPSPPAHCVEEDCQGPLIPAPAAASNGSAIGGRGNGAAQVRCRHGRSKARKGCRSGHGLAGRQKNHRHKSGKHGKGGKSK